jgi:hypothetical protein
MVMKMKRNWFGLILIVTMFSASALGTSPMMPISQGTIDGEWVSIGWEIAEVIRLEIADGKAVLAITRGTKQWEFVLRSDRVFARNGKISFIATDREADLVLDVSGDGWVIANGGKMTLRMANANKEPRYWRTIDRLFIRGSSKGRLDSLINLDERAKALCNGSVKPSLD